MSSISFRVFSCLTWPILSLLEHLLYLLQVGSYSYDMTKMLFRVSKLTFIQKQSIILDYSIEIRNLREKDKIFLAGALGNYSLAGFEMVRTTPHLMLSTCILFMGCIQQFCHRLLLHIVSQFASPFVLWDSSVVFKMMIHRRAIFGSYFFKPSTSDLLKCKGSDKDQTFA